MWLYIYSLEKHPKYRPFSEKLRGGVERHTKNREWQWSREDEVPNISQMFLRTKQSMGNWKKKSLLYVLEWYRMWFAPITTSDVNIQNPLRVLVFGGRRRPMTVLSLEGCRLTGQHIPILLASDGCIYSTSLASYTDSEGDLWHVHHTQAAVFDAMGLRFWEREFLGSPKGDGLQSQVILIFHFQISFYVDAIFRL